MDYASPSPRDIPLALPAPEWLLQGAIVVFFILHILFVNLMLGGAILTLYFERLGYRRGEPKFDALARRIAATVTVNKSLAVVLGVGPLLAMNVLYSVYFYSANALTGTAWVSIVPLAASAFLLLYWHKFSWEKMAGEKRRHMAILIVAVALLLAIPLIFLTNINLMLFPERWTSIAGFFSAAILPNVLPRYAHFLLATQAVTGLFLAWHLGRRQHADLEDLTPPTLRRMFYRVTLYASLAQFLVGPTVYFTLPSRGVTNQMTGVILAGVTMALAGILFLWQEIYETDERIGRGYWFVVAFLFGTVCCMALGRHLYREESIASHRTRMQERTAKFEVLSQAAFDDYQRELAKFPPEQRLFNFRCGACHAIDTVRVGPSLREIAGIYKDKPEGIVAWAMSPGKKRPSFPQMPKMSHVGERDLTTIAQYMISAGSVTAPAASQLQSKE
ncbi:MAG: cytochrome ubiquinol oxidase subunit I [Planctomycetaceae bacterium]|nr:cytochrome ubiquinol oxidase subunit I [Planctomycetaceae bacterium]